MEKAKKITNVCFIIAMVLAVIFVSFSCSYMAKETNYSNAYGMYGTYFVQDEAGETVGTFKDSDDLVVGDTIAFFVSSASPSGVDYIWSLFDPASDSIKDVSISNFIVVDSISAIVGDSIKTSIGFETTSDLVVGEETNSAWLASTFAKDSTNTLAWVFITLAIIFAWLDLLFIVREKDQAKEAEKAKKAQEKAAAKEAQEKEKARIAQEKASAKEAKEKEKARIAKEKEAEKERIAKEKEAKRIEDEKIAAEKAEKDRIAKEEAAKAAAIAAAALAAKKAQEEKERKEAEEKRLAAEKAEKERIAKEKEAKRIEDERIAAEKAEKDRIAKEEAAKAAAIAAAALAAKKAQEEKERKEAEEKRLAAEKAEKERLAKEAEAKRIEDERIAAEKAEKDRIAKEEAAKAAAIAAAALAAKKAEEERIAKQKAEEEAKHKREEKMANAIKTAAAAAAVSKAESKRREAVFAKKYINNNTDELGIVDVDFPEDFFDKLGAVTSNVSLITGAEIRKFIAESMDNDVKASTKKVGRDIFKISFEKSDFGYVQQVPKSVIMEVNLPVKYAKSIMKPYGLTQSVVIESPNWFNWILNEETTTEQVSNVLHSAHYFARYKAEEAAKNNKK